jgi:hypothetical protein
VGWKPSSLRRLQPPEVLGADPSAIASPSTFHQRRGTTARDVGDIVRRIGRKHQRAGQRAGGSFDDDRVLIGAR